MKYPHIGALIKEKFEAKCRADKIFSKAEFARRIGIDRSSVYNLFNHQSIDTELLITISEVLDYPFLEEVYLKKSAVNQQSVIVGVAISAEQLKKLELPEGFIALVENCLK
jgi:transcriptional regulator with XRE-family HTH domain